MTPEQLAHNQRLRQILGREAVPIKVYECRYCGNPLVRLKTVTRCHDVIDINPDWIFWIDENGIPHQHFALTWDHVMPRSKGGGGRNEGNLVPACGPCNRKKDNLIGILLETGEVVFR